MGADNSKRIESINEQLSAGHGVDVSNCLWLLTRVERLERALELALSFAPKGPVPKGLSPEFYHTLNYEDEVALQARIDAAREALKEGE